MTWPYGLGFITKYLTFMDIQTLLIAGRAFAMGGVLKGP
jgi:hypothetical protein